MWTTHVCGDGPVGSLDWARAWYSVWGWFGHVQSGLTSPGRPGNCHRRMGVIWTIDEM
ncbi:hypothetical protein Bca4012_010295 [Brassica carinata]